MEGICILTAICCSRQKNLHIEMAENVLTLKIFLKFIIMLQALKHWSMQLDFPGFNNDARIAGSNLYFLVGERRETRFQITNRIFFGTAFLCSQR